MTAIAKSVQIGIAACVIAVAAVLTPAAVSQADPAAPVPQVVGGSAGRVDISPECGVVGLPDCVAPAAASPGVGANSILQNNLWWIGASNPNAPPRTTVWTFQPLNLLPQGLRDNPLFGWFNNVDFEVCLVGVSIKIGPYGTVTGSYATGGGPC